MDGWLQGYNAQAATNEQQIVLAAEVMFLTGLRAPGADVCRHRPRTEGGRYQRGP
jgi:hypothetical protein